MNKFVKVALTLMITVTASASSCISDYKSELKNNKNHGAPFGYLALGMVNGGIQSGGTGFIMSSISYGLAGPEIAIPALITTTADLGANLIVAYPKVNSTKKMISLLTEAKIGNGRILNELYLSVAKEVKTIKRSAVAQIVNDLDNKKTFCHNEDLYTYSDAVDEVLFEAKMIK